MSKKYISTNDLFMRASLDLSSKESRIFNVFHMHKHFNRAYIRRRRNVHGCQLEYIIMCI